VLARIAASGAPKELGNSDRVAIGVLLNAGLIRHAPPVGTSHAALVVSEDVRFSLMLDDE